MRVLLVTGLKEELAGILRAGFHWDPDSRLYRSLQQPDLLAGTSGPGLRSRKQLRKAILRCQPDVIVNGGLVGVLPDDSGYNTGDRLALGEVIDAASGLIYPGGRGHERLISVDRPVFQPLEKMNLHLDSRATVCDMEAAPLLQLLGELAAELPELFVVFCKVVGDLPEDYFLFRMEERIRGWSQKTAAEKLGVFLRHPRDTADLLRLFRLKRRALDSLTGKLGAVVRRLFRVGRVDEDMDSVFIPH